MGVIHEKVRTESQDAVASGINWVRGIYQIQLKLHDKNPATSALARVGGGGGASCLGSLDRTEEGLDPFASCRESFGRSYQS